MPFPVNHGTSSDDLLLKVSFPPLLLVSLKTRLMKSLTKRSLHVVYGGCTYVLYKSVLKSAKFMATKDTIPKS